MPNPELFGGMGGENLEKENFEIQKAKQEVKEVFIELLGTIEHDTEMRKKAEETYTNRE